MNPVSPSHGPLDHSGTPPPTLCSHCRHGIVQLAAAPADELEPHRAPERFEIAFCRNPDIAGRDEPPREMEHVVLECQGFAPKTPTTAPSSAASGPRRSKKGEAYGAGEIRGATA